MSEATGVIFGHWPQASSRNVPSPQPRSIKTAGGLPSSISHIQGKNFLLCSDPLPKTLRRRSTVGCAISSPVSRLPKVRKVRIIGREEQEASRSLEHRAFGWGERVPAILARSCQKIQCLKVLEQAAKNPGVPDGGKVFDSEALALHRFCNSGFRQGRDCLARGLAPQQGDDSIPV